MQAAVEQCERRAAGTASARPGQHRRQPHRVQNTRGVTTLANHGSDLTAADLQKALDSAKAVPLPPDREIIHVVPRSYVLDGQEGIKNPIGMSGHRLEAETHVITGAVGSIQNLIKAVQRTGLELDDMVLQPLASAEAVLTQEERELGGVLVDIGGGTTDVAVFLDGSVWHTAVIGLGGNHISNDIAICLRTPLANAEEMKIAYGHADPAAVADLPPIDVPTFERHRVQQVPREYLAQIIQVRLEEILGFVASEIKRSGYSGLLGAGVILAGGVAEQAGIKELAEVDPRPAGAHRPAPGGRPARRAPDRPGLRHRRRAADLGGAQRGGAGHRDRAGAERTLVRWPAERGCPERLPGLSALTGSSEPAALPD